MSPSFCPADFWPSVATVSVHVWMEGTRGVRCIPGCTEPARRSPAPLRDSDAFSVLDLVESGWTARLSVYSTQGTVRVRHLTLLGGLLAESLAHGVRHVAVGMWLEVVVVELCVRVMRDGSKDCNGGAL